MKTSKALCLLLLDDNLCVLNKPSGIMVHRTNISTDRVFLADLLRERLGRRVWTVHRLDRATSGALLLALTAAAAADLGEQFEAGTIGKRYVAVVRGWIDDAGAIDKPLKAKRGRIQQALTRYRCLARTEIPVPIPPHETARYSLVELRPVTGRTHQLRRHLNHVSHPIVGDVNHGDRRHNRLFRSRFACHRLLLHAAEIRFAHPADGRAMHVEARPPEDFASVVGALGWADVALGTDTTADASGRS